MVTRLLWLGIVVLAGTAPAARAAASEPWKETIRPADAVTADSVTM